jgi:indolepyruvate ferredoxin oxidoreductase
MNLQAFAWGRQAALDLDAVRSAAGLKTDQVVVLLPNRLPTLAHLITDRTKRLADYQNPAYAARFERFVRKIAAIEQQRTGGDRFSREVAVSLYKLMAYKDEYEVARLHVESGFFERIKAQFDGDLSLRFHLAPPLLAKRDADGHLVKKAYGPWVATAFKWLARARVVRGTALDVFGYTAERRGERAAIGAFEALVRDLVAQLDAPRLQLAVELARLPQSVRGFGHVKERNAAEAEVKQAALLAQFQGPVEAPLRAAA